MRAFLLLWQFKFESHFILQFNASKLLEKNEKEAREMALKSIGRFTLTLPNLIYEGWNFKRTVIAINACST